MSFVASDFSLGRQRCRQWASLITQQLRLRHVNQIYAYNLPSEKRTLFYFTLHKTCMSSPFYTSEKSPGKHPKWNELLFQDVETNYSSVVIRIWKSGTGEDQIVTTWGVNFSGLVYLGSKIADLHPKYFELNTVIFYMQGGFFTSQSYIKTDLEGALPFRAHLNLVEKDNNELVLYRRIAIKSPKGEVQATYNLEKLRQLQELQRIIKNKSIDVRNVKEQIRATTESEEKESNTSQYQNNIRFAPQLLTMNSLNKMLHGKPTKIEREQMEKLTERIEETKFRLRLLSTERDKLKVNLRKLKQKEAALTEENDDKSSKLMILYRSLSKDVEQFKRYRHSFLHHTELFVHTTKQLCLRQRQLLKELLFIYPIEKMPNEDKYKMLGIYLPNSEILTDCSDAGISVVLGYICHILIMSSIFLQVPLRYPMRHFGSRSVIYDQVSNLIPDKDREFPLYTKDKDKAHFGYAVFLLNKNLSQLRWSFYRWYTLDLKETLMHLYRFLLGSESGDIRFSETVCEDSPRLCGDGKIVCGSPNGPSEGVVALEKLVSFSSSSSSTVTDPLLDSILQEIKQHRSVVQSPVKKSPRKKLGFFRSSRKQATPEECSEGSTEVLALPEAYLNKQITKDLFDRCASGNFKLSGQYPGLIVSNSLGHCDDNKIRLDIKEFQADASSSNSDVSDVIEQGTDPLDPATNLDALITKSIAIKTEGLTYSLPGERISRSAGSYVENNLNSFIRTSLELGSDPLISCNKIAPSGGSSSDITTFDTWLTGDTGDVVSIQGSQDLRNVSCPLTVRTDRLLCANQSFNLVKNRNADTE